MIYYTHIPTHSHTHIVCCSRIDTNAGSLIEVFENFRYIYRTSFLDASKKKEAKQAFEQRGCSLAKRMMKKAWIN